VLLYRKRNSQADSNLKSLKKRLGILNTSLSAIIQCMAEDKIVLAIFDFDGTLTNGHMWTGIARHHMEKRVNRVAVYSYFFSHIPLWLAAKAKLYDEEKDKIKWGEDLPALIKASL